MPLTSGQRARIQLDDPSAYARLAEGAEAWAFRRMQDRGELMDRPQLGRRLVPGGVRAGGQAAA